MDQAWITAEVKLYREMMSPRRRKITLHSLSPNIDKKKYDNARQAIEKQKDRELPDSWRAYDQWINH